MSVFDFVIYIYIHSLERSSESEELFGEDVVYLQFDIGFATNLDAKNMHFSVF